MRSVLFTAIYLTAAGCPAAVTFDFAWVDNAGNAPDPETGFGAVPYEYSIAKTEVTNAQYAEFLNAVDPTGENRLQLYDFEMGRHVGGLAMSGTVDGARYAPRPGREDHPVIYVSWYDAIRFANWMHNGQGDGDTETGAYTLGPLLANGLPINQISIEIDPGARYWIPTEDEWYKAAYHDASAGTAGVYFDYATGSDEVPISDRPEDNPAAANYIRDDGLNNGFNDGSAVPGGFRDSPFTPSGAYFLARSPYGVFDQVGNVTEWITSRHSESLIPARGVPWNSGVQFATSQTRFEVAPFVERSNLGFRVASVPEPSSVAWIGCVLVAADVMRATRVRHRCRLIARLPDG